MVDYMKAKRELRNELMLAIRKAPVVNYDKLVAEACLKTGFSASTVRQMLKQLADTGYISTEPLTREVRALKKNNGVK